MGFVGVLLALGLAPTTPASASLPERGGRCHWRSASTVRLTDADSGRKFCVHPGQVISVVLSVDPAQFPDPSQWWAPVSHTGRALRARPQILLAIRGTTLAAYDAVRPGRATLSSTRSVCPAPPPDGVSCAALVAWQVVIVVRPPAGPPPTSPPPMSPPAMSQLH